MPVGKRNFRIKLQRLKTVGEGATRNSAGHIDTSDNNNWTDAATRWAMVHPRGGREFLRAQQLNSKTTHVVEMDHDSVTSTATPAWRIKDANNSRYLNILSVYNAEERDRSIVMACEEPT